jgi:hypothetical protein
MITRPSALRAARPMVWISEVSERRNPSLSASRIATSPHSGMSSPSRSRLMPTSTSKAPEPQVAQDLDALDRVDVGMHVAHADALFVQVFGQVLGHALGQHGAEHPKPGAATLRTSSSRSSTCIDTGRISIIGSIEAGGADHLLDEDAAGLLQLPGPAWRRRRPTAGAWRPIPRTSAGGCPCRRAAGSRARPG